MSSVGVGLMGWVSTCEFIVCFRICCSSLGVCMVAGRLVWLWMQLIDVMDGSKYW